MTLGECFVGSGLRRMDAPVPFTPRHYNSSFFVTARQQYGCMSYMYIPLTYFLIVDRKRPFRQQIYNSFFLMLLSGDIHVNPGPINGYSTSPSSPPPNFAAATLPPPSPPSAGAAVDSGPPPPNACPPPSPHQ